MPETIIYSDDLIKFKKDLEEETGFASYETMPGDQTTFFGTSSKFDDFKTAVADKFNTGTIAYLMDTSKKYMYSRYTNTWYELS